jgi:leader peptidase (prepilin peptidase)/N-methyltransferase
MLHVLQNSAGLVLGATAALGLIVGSFLNVVIHRLPARLEFDWRRQCDELAGGGAPPPQPSPPGLVRPGSHCPHCGHAITALENVPVLSYLVLRGRCSACGERISWRYPVVELMTGTLSVLVIWHFGVGIAGATALLLTWGLVALAWIDVDHQILPDAIVLPLLWIGLLVNIDGTFTDLPSAVIGAAAGYLSLWLVYHVFRLITGKEGMGYGDFKLFAVFGAWLGWQLLPLIILLSAAAGAVIGLAGIVALGRDRNVPIPFGPYLAIAGWIAMLWGDDITGAYLRFVGIP